MHLSRIAGALLSLCALGSAQGQKVGWSLGYYCGWDQGSFPPSRVNWKAFTHIAHFTVFPNNDGTLNPTSNGLTDANCKAAVAEAHRNGVKIVFSVGGAGAKDLFKSATAPENLERFVKNLLDFMRKYGYDGIDTDWEENFDDARLLALHKMLRDSLDKITPRPLLTMAGGGYFASHCAPAWPYLDQLNTMSYDIEPSGLSREVQSFTSRGVPKKVLGIGIGIGSGGLMTDGDTISSKAKAQYVLDNGLGGIMAWAVKGGDLNTSVFQALEQYVPPHAVGIYARRGRASGQDMLLITASRSGRREIRYAIPPQAGQVLVDLGLFAADGTLLRRLVHGTQTPGNYVLSLETGPAWPAGGVFARLRTGEGMRAAAIPLLP